MIKKNVKLYIFNILLIIIIIFLLYNTKLVTESIKTSTNLFIDKIIPSLFIYLFITEILINSGQIDNLKFGKNLLHKLFHIPLEATPTVIIGYLLGYPNSAKYILKLFDEGKITNEDATKLMAFTSCASPAYIISAVGLGLFHNITSGLILFISHLLASIILGIFTRPKLSHIIQQKKIKENSFKQIYSFFDILSTSTLNTLKTLGMIFGFMCIFSLIPHVLTHFFNISHTLRGIITGLLEVSNGINDIASCNIPFIYALSIVSFLISFSSIMVHMQLYVFLKRAHVSFKSILKYKLLHGVLAFIITYFLASLLNTESISVYSNLLTHNKYSLQLPPSLVYIIIATLTLLILLISYRKKRQ